MSRRNQHSTSVGLKREYELSRVCFDQLSPATGQIVSATWTLLLPLTEVGFVHRASVTE